MPGQRVRQQLQRRLEVGDAEMAVRCAVLDRHRQDSERLQAGGKPSGKQTRPKNQDNYT